jgi:hypothetical protein
LRIDIPAACASVVAECKRFEGAFSQDGKNPPCDPTVPEPPDEDDDIFGADGCRTVPARFVVLGDSIADCFIEPHATCASYMIADLLKQRYAPGLAFETHAMSGALTADLPVQARQVKDGPGHVAVWIWAIGNDLLSNNIDPPGWEASWREVFDYFTDTSRFPDGATFMLNGQYSAFDECGNETQTALEAAARAANKRLFIDVAIARPDTIAIDHYPDFLGHTGHAGEQGCHCRTDASYWLQGGPHPNTLGYAHITEKWRVAMEGLYGKACAR